MTAVYGSMIIKRLLINSQRISSNALNQVIMVSAPHLRLFSPISNLENSELIRLPNLEEVKTALFSIDSNKTPGSDGSEHVFLRTTGISLKKTFSTVS